MELKNMILRMWTGFMWPRIGSTGGFLWARSWSFGFHNRRGISWLAESFREHSAPLS